MASGEKLVGIILSGPERRSVVNPVQEVREENNVVVERAGKMRGCLKEESGNNVSSRRATHPESAMKREQECGRDLRRIKKHRERLERQLRSKGSSGYPIR